MMVPILLSFKLTILTPLMHNRFTHHSPTIGTNQIPILPIQHEITLIVVPAGIASLPLFELVFGRAGGDGCLLVLVFQGGGVGGGVGAEAEDDRVVDAFADGFEFRVGDFGAEEVGDAAGCGG